MPSGLIFVPLGVVLCVAIQSINTQTQAQRTIVIGRTDADITAVAGLLLFTKTVFSTNFETAEVGAGVGDSVLSTRGIACLTAVPSQRSANAGVTESIVAAHSQVGRGQHATQAHGAEATFQAHGRGTAESHAIAVCVHVVVTIIHTHACFQVEGGFQAVAQVFHAAEAQTAVHVTTHVGHAVNGFFTFAVGQAGVQNTVQGHGRLGHSSAGSSQHSQGDQGFFHCNYSKV